MSVASAVRVLYGGLPLMVAGVAVLVLTSCGKADRPAGPADLVLRNGKIVTLNPALAEARALAVVGDRIAAVGSDREIAAWIGPRTEVIDLGGHLALPGFIEGHAHLLKIGEQKMTLDLSSSRSWDEVVERVRQAARDTAPGVWIFGRGWHQERWERPPEHVVRGFPVHDALSAASPANPVHLRHASGHASIDNARAMERVGIAASTPDPPGGEIVRDARGRPTGVFLENAEEPFLRAYEQDRAERSPAGVEVDKRRAVELAVEECLSKGITSFQDAGESFEDIDRLMAMVDEGRLGMRVWAMVSADSPGIERRLDDYRRIGYGDHRLTVRAIKAYADGALGSRGAWLLEPYSDLPSSTGQNTVPLPTLERAARLAAQHGFQMCIHAIGDRANREVLDLYARVLGERADGRELRWRVEHAQHLDPADVGRFARLGVIASMQAVHCTSDGPWVVARLGVDRARLGAYLWRSLIDSGAVVINGTDAPVEDVDPIRNFYAAVTRKLADGSRFFPEQRMTREEALRAATAAAAYAAFEEDLKGSLEPGKLADVTVLSRDLLTVPEDEIPGTEVLYTIVGGRVAYHR